MGVCYHRLHCFCCHGMFHAYFCNHIWRHNRSMAKKYEKQIVFLTFFFQVLADPDENYVRSETNKYSLYFVIAGIIVGVSMFLQVIIIVEFDSWRLYTDLYGTWQRSPIFSIHFFLKPLCSTSLQIYYHTFFSFFSVLHQIMVE